MPREINYSSRVLPGLRACTVDIDQIAKKRTEMAQFSNALRPVREYFSFFFFSFSSFFFFFAARFRRIQPRNKSAWMRLVIVIVIYGIGHRSRSFHNEQRSILTRYQVRAFLSVIARFHQLPTHVSRIQLRSLPPFIGYTEQFFRP